MASAATVATTATAAATGTGAAADYDVVTIPAGGHRVFRVDEGETLENLLIDVSAPGASAVIAAHAANTTVRNVGFRGQNAHHGGIIGASDTGGGTSVFENIYIGDGAERGHRVGVGMWTNPDHNGHIVIDRVNIQEMGDNSFYCSAPGGRGTVEIKNCYSANSWVSHFRLARGSVTNCVALNDDRRDDGRGVWAWGPGPVEVRDCDLEMNSRHYAFVAGANAGSSTIDVSDTQWSDEYNSGIRQVNGSTVNFHSGNGKDPDGSRMPDGCPTSAEEAASGSSSATLSTDDDSAPPGLTVETDGSAEYYVEVREGSIEPDDSGDGDVYAHDERRVAGRLEGGTHHLDYDTSLADIHVVGDADVEIHADGDSAEPNWDRYPSAHSDGRDWFEAVPWYDGEPDEESADAEEADTEELPHVIFFRGSDEGVTRYEFGVDGEVVPSNYEGATIDDDTEIEDGVVHGVVADWTEAFRFDGEITQLTLDGPATVSVDDEQVDPDDFGDQLPHVLEVRAGDEPASYEITVDGTIEFDGDDPKEDVTIVTGKAVQSSNTASTQRFRFSGTLTDVTLTDGHATVLVDGEEIDLDECGDTELLPHALVIDGTETCEPSTYSFTVSGKVTKSNYRGASVDEGDVIEDGTVRGDVGNWLNAFWFSGDVEDCHLVGDATIHVEYNARDQ